MRSKQGSSSKSAKTSPVHSFDLLRLDLLTVRTLHKLRHSEKSSAKRPSGPPTLFLARLPVLLMSLGHALHVRFGFGDAGRRGSTVGLLCCPGDDSTHSLASWKHLQFSVLRNAILQCMLVGLISWPGAQEWVWLDHLAAAWCKSATLPFLGMECASEHLAARAQATCQEQPCLSFITH